MTRAKILWRTPLVLFPLAVAGPIAYGCADPVGDLGDFEARRDEAKRAANAGSNAGGSGGSGGASGTGGAAGGTGGVADIDGQFLFACTTDLTDDIGTALRFVADVDLTLDGGAGAGGAATGGSLTVTLRAVRSGGTTSADLVSEPLPADNPAKLDAAGEFVFSYASVQIPGAANTTGRNIVLNNAAFKGVVQSADRFCARFRGDVAQPLQVPLPFSSASNTCVGARIDASGVLPVFTAGDSNACRAATAALTPPP